MTAIDELKAEVERLKLAANRAAEAHQEAKAKLKAAQCAEAGIAVGDIVRAKGKLWRVLSIDVWDFGNGLNFSLHGNPQRKDGSFGTGNRYVGSNWERA